MANPPPILIAGATSNVGRLLTATLLAQKHKVRVLVRSREAGNGFASAGADVVIGDVREPETLELACQGIHTVISLVGRHYASSRRTLWEIDADGNRNLIQAARDAGVDHFVLMSLLWTDRNLPPIIIPAKAAAESALMESGMRFSILRPATFITGPNSLIGLFGPTIERYGIAVVASQPSGPVSFISTEDLAEAILNIALGSGPSNRVYELGGPERLTLAEAAQQVGTVLNRRVRFVRVPLSLIRAARSILKPVAFGPYESLLFYEMIIDHGYYCGSSVLEEVLGRPPKSVDECLRAYYADGRRTPWRDSIYGSWFIRSK